MVQYKDIHKEVANYKNYFILALILTFICVISYLISIMIETPIKYTSFVITTLMTSFFLYRGVTPLFIQYKDYIYKLSEIARKALAEMKKEEAEKKNILADLQDLEAIYEKEKAEAKQLVKELSEMRIRLSDLQNDLNELQAGEQKELAMYKQEVSKLKDYLSKVQSENNQNAVRVAKLQKAEPYLFLVELQVTPQQVANSITNAINAKKYNSPEHKEEMLKLLDTVKNSKIIHV